MSETGERVPTQIERVLALLRTRAAEGKPVNTADLLAPAVDGGKPILRLPSRINELRDAGYRIDTERTSNRTANYYLRGEPRPTLPEASDCSELEHQGALFSTADLLPRNELARYRDQEAA